MPLADQRAKLVGGEVKIVEVGLAVLTLNFVYPEVDFSGCVLLILLWVGKGTLEYPSLQSIVGILETGGTVNECLSDTMNGLVYVEGSFCEVRLTLIWKVEGVCVQSQDLSPTIVLKVLEFSKFFSRYIAVNIGEREAQSFAVARVGGDRERSMIAKGSVNCLVARTKGLAAAEVFSW